MVYELKKPKDEEELVGQEGQGIQSPELLNQQDSTIEGGGGQLSQASTPIAAQTKPTGGSGLTDINKYLDVNRDKAQALGQKVSGVIQGDINKAQEGLAGAGTQFGEEVAANTVAMDQGVFDAGKAALTDQTAEGYDPTAAQGFMDKSGSDFGKQFGASYQGPQSIQSQKSYLDAQDLADTAQESAANVNTSQGRQELIARATTPRGGRFSKGALALDQALLQGDETAYSNLQQTAEGAGDLESRMLALEDVAAAKVAEGKDITTATNEAYAEEFNLGREEQELTDAFTGIRDEAQIAEQTELERITNMASEYGIDPNAFYDSSQLAGLNRYNTTSAEDYDRLSALANLTGQAGTFGGYSELAGQGGGLTDSSKYFDEGRYREAVKGSRSNVERANAVKAAIAKQAADAAAKKESIKKSFIASAVGGIVAGPVGSVIGSIFCFEETTPFELITGEFKQIKDIELNDVLKVGGRVLSTMVHVFEGDIYSYDAPDHIVLVSAYHAVFENGTWLRVKDSKNAQRIARDILPVDKVYTLNTETHRLKSGGQLFADYQEVDNDHLFTDEQCLEILNKNENRSGLIIEDPITAL